MGLWGRGFLKLFCGFAVLSWLGSADLRAEDAHLKFRERQNSELSSANDEFAAQAEAARQAYSKAYGLFINGKGPNPSAEKKKLEEIQKQRNERIAEIQKRHREEETAFIREQSRWVGKGQKPKLSVESSREESPSPSVAPIKSDMPKELVYPGKPKAKPKSKGKP